MIEAVEGKVSPIKSLVAFTCRVFGHLRSEGEVIVLQAVKGWKRESIVRLTDPSSCIYAHNLGFLPAVSCKAKEKGGD